MSSKILAKKASIKVLETGKDATWRALLCEKDKLSVPQEGANLLSNEVLRMREANRSLKVLFQEDDEARVDDRKGGRLLELAVKNARRLADPTETGARLVRD